MNHENSAPEKAISRFWAQPELSRSEIEQSADRILGNLAMEYEKLPRQPGIVGDGKSRRDGFRWTLVAAAATLLAACLMLLRVDSGTSIATVEEGTINALKPGDSVRSNQAFHVSTPAAAIALKDGSQVELSQNSDFSLKKVSDGIELRLEKGSVIVTASKQRSGHLYVRTSDCTVSVTGTVFAVRSESSGSRVSVYEGQVRVTQGKSSYSLERGQQLATSPIMGAPGLESEIQWSHNASSVLALLQAPADVNIVPAGAESIEGIVTDNSTGAPLAGVSVLVAAPQSPLVVFDVNSGSDGRFKVERVPPGLYKLISSQPGYWDVSGPEVTVASGQVVQGVRLRMARTATLSGRVVEENGNPISSLALELRVLSGERMGRILTEANTGARGGTTNDRGEYEFTDVLPGTYYVRTRLKMSYDTLVYYPGTLDLDNAMRIELLPGAVLTGINISLPPMKLFSIRFQVPKDALQWFERQYGKPGPTKGPMATGAYSQGRAVFSSPLSEQLSAAKIVPTLPPSFVLERKGRLVEDIDTSFLYPRPSRLTSLGNDQYILSGVAPGKYQLRLSWNVNDLAGMLNGETPKQSWASVNADVEVIDKDLDLGRLASRPGHLSIPVRFTYADGIPVEVAVTAGSTTFGGRALLNSQASTLQLNNLDEGTYVVQFLLADTSHYISIARYGSQDLFSGPLVLDGGDRSTLEIVVDGPGGVVEGIVRDSRGDAISSVSVVLVPPPFHRGNPYLFRNMKSDQNGKFRFVGVAPGEYDVYAWDFPTFHLDPEWLRNYETRGTPVSVRKGQTVSANVRLILQAR